MAPIPLTSFRILEKKTNWKKSFDEILSDGEKDFEELLLSVKFCRNRLFNSTTEEFGALSGATLEIMKLWLNYFVFIMRVNVKVSYISIGESNRGIPSEVVRSYRSLAENQKTSGMSLMMDSSKNHEYFFLFHFNDEKERMSKSKYFEFLFDETYLPIIEAAYSVVSENPFFDEKTLDFQELIRSLRLEWIPVFKQIY